MPTTFLLISAARRLSVAILILTQLGVLAVWIASYSHFATIRLTLCQQELNFEVSNGLAKVNRLPAFRGIEVQTWLEDPIPETIFMPHGRYGFGFNYQPPMPLSLLHAHVGNRAPQGTSIVIGAPIWFLQLVLLGIPYLVLRVVGGGAELREVSPSASPASRAQQAGLRDRVIRPLARDCERVRHRKMQRG